MPRWLKKVLCFLFVRIDFTVRTKRTKSEVLDRVGQITENSPEIFFWRMTRRGFWLCERQSEDFEYGNVEVALAPVVLARMSEKDGITAVKVAIRPNLVAYLFYLPLHLLFTCCLITIPIARICTKAFYERAESLYDRLETYILEDLQ